MLQHRKRVWGIMPALLLCMALTACSGGPSVSHPPATATLPAAPVQSENMATTEPASSPTVEATPATMPASMAFGAEGGNLLNGGSWCFKDGTLYGMQGLSASKIGIFAQKKDGSTNLAEGIGSQINISGGYMYYLSYPKGLLYRVTVDATQAPQKISDAKMLFLLVVGDTIYYTLAPSAALYVMKTDGTGKQLLSEGKCYDLGGYGDLIYYTDTKSKTFCMRNALTGETNFIPMHARGFAQIMGTRIYYQNEQDGKKLYSSNLDGSDNRVIYDKAITALNASGDAVYFADNSGSGKILKANPDGSGLTQIAAIKAEFIAVCGKELYVVSNQRKALIYHIDENGKLQRLF